MSAQLHQHDMFEELMPEGSNLERKGDGYSNHYINAKWEVFQKAQEPLVRRLRSRERYIKWLKEQQLINYPLFGWVIFAKNGNVRMWTRDNHQAERWVEEGEKIEPVYTKSAQQDKGYVLVPIEPTGAMVKAGGWCDHAHSLPDNHVIEIYKAMIQAAQESS